MTSSTSRQPIILPDGRMDPANAGLYLGVSVKTLAMWRSYGRGPKFIKQGGSRVFYFESDLREWISQGGKVESTAEARFKAGARAKVKPLTINPA
jgi:predicted DNA-binding transcriptional regulator AlpA